MQGLWGKEGTYLAELVWHNTAKGQLSTFLRTYMQKKWKKEKTIIGEGGGGSLGNDQKKYGSLFRMFIPIMNTRNSIPIYAGQGVNGHGNDGGWIIAWKTDCFRRIPEYRRMLIDNQRPRHD